ncbi:MAG: hypothetical protein ACOYM3_01685 [Terrimicrobiaceae bacterium]
MATNTIWILLTKGGVQVNRSSVYNYIRMWSKNDFPASSDLGWLSFQVGPTRLGVKNAIQTPQKIDPHSTTPAVEISIPIDTTESQEKTERREAVFTTLKEMHEAERLEEQLASDTCPENQAHSGEVDSLI